MGFYKSKFTGIEIDKRLEQGTYDDAVKAGFEGTKEEFNLLLSQLKETTNKAADSLASSSDKLETINKDVIDAINEIHQDLSYKAYKNNVVDKEEFNKTVDILNNNLIDSINTINNNVNAGFNIVNEALLETNTTLVEEINIRKNENQQIIADVNKIIEPYTINLTNLLAAQDSESISAAVGGIDNLNGTVQKNQVIFGTLANGTVAVGIRVLGNQTTLTYFVDSLVGLTVNEVIITNTDGTLIKTVNTHAVLTENMVVNSLETDETTLPLSAAQGKVLNEQLEAMKEAKYVKAGEGVESAQKATISINGKAAEVLSPAAGKLANLYAPEQAGAEGQVLMPGDGKPGWQYAKALASVLLDYRKQGMSYINDGTDLDSITTPGLYISDDTPSLANAPSGAKKYSFLVAANILGSTGLVQIMLNSENLIYESSPWRLFVRSGDSTAWRKWTEFYSTGNPYAPLRALYESYGAAYNDETGYWEYGDLEDLTDEDCMLATIYAIDICYVDRIMQPLNRYNKAARTLFTKVKNLNAWSSDSINLHNAFVNNRIEYLKIMNSSANEPVVVYNGKQAFRNCTRLKTIEDILRCNVTGLDIRYMFYNCPELANVKIQKLIVDIGFPRSSKLSYESLKYLVDNAANTKNITVTVNAATYSYLTGTAVPPEYVGGTAEQWQALVTAGQAKQISFAVPEETQSEENV